MLIGIYCAVLTGSDNSGLPAHVSDFKGNTLSVSSVSMILAGGVFINTLYQVNRVIWYYYLVSFYHAWEHLSNTFPVSVEMIILFFSIFDMLNWVSFLKYPCIHMVNSNLSWCIILIIHCWIRGVCAYARTHTSFAYLYTCGSVCIYIYFRCFSSVFMSKNAPSHACWAFFY